MNERWTYAMAQAERLGKAATRSRPPSVGYNTEWLQDFLQRASGLSFTATQAEQVAALAERKLIDLFDVAVEAALANGRARIMRHDLPITKGLRGLRVEAEAAARLLDLPRLLVFLDGAGVPGPLDELVKQEIPRLMAAMLLLAGRIIALLEPENMSPEERLERLLRGAPNEPTQWELERTARVLNLTL
jgi:hypothetical protein